MSGMFTRTSIDYIERAPVIDNLHDVTSSSTVARDNPHPWSTYPARQKDGQTDGRTDGRTAITADVLLQRLTAVGYDAIIQTKLALVNSGCLRRMKVMFLPRSSCLSARLLKKLWRVFDNFLDGWAIDQETASDFGGERFGSRVPGSRSCRQPRMKHENLRRMF